MVIAHASEHRANLATLCDKQGVVLLRQIFAVASKINPSFRLSVLALRAGGYEPEAVRISQLAHKMGFVPALGPLRCVARDFNSSAISFVFLLMTLINVPANAQLLVFHKS